MKIIFKILKLMKSKKKNIFYQVLFNILPSLCIWLAYLLPAHSMSGLYSNSDEYSIWEYTGMFITRTHIKHSCISYVNVLISCRLYVTILDCFANISTFLFAPCKHKNCIVNLIDANIIGHNISWWLCYTYR